MKPPDIHALEPPLATREMFLYLHNRHAGLVPRMAEALRGMREDGTSTRIERETILRHLGSNGPWNR